MRKAEEVMAEFMRILENMERNQGINIRDPLTHNFNKDILEKAYTLEKNTISTQTGEEIKKLPKEDDGFER